MNNELQRQTLAEPRDNVDIFPPKGNLHKSSYQRLGPDVACTGMSETQAMLSQIELKEQYAPIYPQRSLFHMRSLASTDKDEEEDVKLTDILLDPEEARRMDYRTTMEIDFRLHYPIKPKPPPPPPPSEPWLLHRRTIGYSLHELEKRDGMNTFLDDNMELHNKIADLKLRRNNLYETLLKDNPPPNFSKVPGTEVEELRLTYS